MATPCSACVYRGTSFCAVFCGRSSLEGCDVEKAPEKKRSLAVLAGGGESGLEGLRWNPRLFPLVVALLLFFAVSSWAVCGSSGTITSQYGTLVAQPLQYSKQYQYSCPSPYESSICPALDVESAPDVKSCSYGYCIKTSQEEKWDYGNFSGSCFSGIVNCRLTRYTYYGRYCTTESEADSLFCVLNPNAEGCAVETDTTLWACTEGIADGATYSELYRLSCRAKNGEVVSCNGKTNVDVTTDGQLVRRMQGTCAANGYTNGIQSGGGGGGGGSPTAQCIAAIGSNCYMRDARSGNTFTCACDGDCEHAIRQVATGGCVNPYPQDSLQNDSATLPLPSSSDDWQPSSSAAEPSSAASFANELEGIEKLYGVLDTIRDTLNRKIAPSVLDIQANTQYIGTQVSTANGWLQQIAGKDWSPTINVGAPDVTIEGDTNIINVTVQGDTARAGAAILEWLRDENYSFSNSVDSTHYLQALAEADSTRRWADSVSAYEVPRKDGDSLAAAAVGTRGALRALRDTINGGAFGDSLARWESLITNNGVITGNGSDNCPSVLTQPVIFRFPHVGDINAGTLGKYICTPIAGINITLWALIRVLLRASVAIACMYWIFKAVTGTDGGEEE